MTATEVTLVTATGLGIAEWSGPVRSAASLGSGSGTADPAEYLLLCAPGVDLLPGAESRVREMLIHDPEIDLAYFDSTGSAESAGEACHRPGFSPDRLAAQDYIGPVVLIRQEILDHHRRIGPNPDRPIRLPLDHGQLVALADRCQVIGHLPQLVYRSALGAGPVNDLVPSLVAGRQPLVSIVIPTRGDERRLDGHPVVLCLNAIDHLVARTDYRPFEVVVVLTPGWPEGLPARVLATLERHPVVRRPTIRFCADDRPFNFSDACNRGAVTARGDVLVFLNDDTAPRTADWLHRLVARAIDPEVGAVGAKLLYGDGSIQHAGIWSRGGHPVHRYEGFRNDHRGHLDSLAAPQNCLAVTGACLAVETEKFHRAGGFCPEFPSSYNDVDLCLKLDALGHRTVIDPGAVLDHYEASTRDPGIEDSDLEFLSRRWRRKLIDDPYDNPNHVAPGADEFPPPDAAITVERQRRQGYGHPARIWRRRRPVTDLIDLERGRAAGPAVDRPVDRPAAPMADPMMTMAANPVSDRARDEVTHVL